jgi:hypothetical protein
MFPCLRRSIDLFRTFCAYWLTTPVNYQRLRIDESHVLPLVFSLGKVANGAEGQLEAKGSNYEGIAFRSRDFA